MSGGADGGPKDGAALASIEPGPGAAVMALASGRVIEAVSTERGDLVRIRASGGECVVTIEVTDAGPVLRFSGAASLELAAASIDVACERLRMRASEGIAMEAGGGVAIRANDDVAIDGERVMLNSSDPPMPLTMEEYRARRSAARAALGAGGEAGGEPASGGEGAAG